jgi:hypothetical protein
MKPTAVTLSSSRSIFLCRWLNGDLPVVNAKTKTDAIEPLDELGNAEPAWLTRMTDCIFDFGLADDGRIEPVALSKLSKHNVINM